MYKHTKLCTGNCLPNNLGLPFGGLFAKVLESESNFGPRVTVRVLIICVSMLIDDRRILNFIFRSMCNLIKRTSTQQLGKPHL